MGPSGRCNHAACDVGNTTSLRGAFLSHSCPWTAPAGAARDPPDLCGGGGGGGGGDRILNPKPKPQAPDPRPYILNPKPETRNPKPLGFRVPA